MKYLFFLAQIVFIMLKIFKVNPFWHTSWWTIFIPGYVAVGLLVIQIAIILGLYKWFNRKVN